MPERLRNAKNRLVGTKQALKAVEAGRAKVVYIARDAEERVTAPINRHAEQHGIEIVSIESMHELGKMCGIEVGAAAAAILPREDLEEV